MFSLNIKGRLVEFQRPAVMAIINATPDSFYSASRAADADDVASRAERALAEGADIIDLGAYSSRPGAAEVSTDEEMRRLVEAVRAVRRVSPDVPLSVDTFRASVAEAALAEGADIVNDISGGMLDPEMDSLIARNNTPYIIMHMRGTPSTMVSLTDYSDDGSVTAAVVRFFARRVSELASKGADQIILDPGFGFAKTAEQNWELMAELPLIRESFPRPLLVGISRKSMFYKPLGLTPEAVLPATCYGNTLALQGGADILRVHDVGAARQIVDLFSLFPDRSNQVLLTDF
ncbi:MAG: dihydropteroate synthase [Muribaculaceae bacterium]|nr:dihydropteroate synthase [Muribaculaceae bacterium]